MHGCSGSRIKQGMKVHPKVEPVASGGGHDHADCRASKGLSPRFGLRKLPVYDGRKEVGFTCATQSYQTHLAVDQ